MTYNEFLSKFERCDYYDYSLDTKGMYRHHVEPKAVQKKKYGEVVNHDCVIVSCSDHIRCHYYYWIEHKDDKDEGFALASLLQLEKDQIWDLTETEMERIAESLEGFEHHLSEDHKRKISEAQKGRKLPEERVKKMSERNMGEKNPNYGTTWSEERRAKMMNTIRNRSEERNREIGRKISENRKGNKVSRDIKLKTVRAKGCRPFLMENGEMSMKFEIISECEKWLRENGHPTAQHSAISRVLKRKRKSAYGFTYRYIEEDTTTD